MANSVECYTELEYLDPTDLLTKTLSYTWQYDYQPTQIELFTRTYEEVLLTLDEYKFKLLGIVAVGELIDTDSFTYYCE